MTVQERLDIAVENELNNSFNKAAQQCVEILRPFFGYSEIPEENAKTTETLNSLFFLSGGRLYCRSSTAPAGYLKAMKADANAAIADQLIKKIITMEE